MDNMKEEQKMTNYQYLVERFGKEKILSRYEWIYQLMESYLVTRGCQENVLISTDILNHVIVDYFVDIDRLKEFQEIEKVHCSKIYAYMSYWLLRHKPMQLIQPENIGEFAFINEEFVCHLMRSYLFSDPDNVPILHNQTECIDTFVDTMLYYFQYREYSAKNIEIMILAFLAGRGYQYSVDHQ